MLDRDLAQSILTSALRQAGPDGSSIGFALLAVHPEDSRAVASVSKGCAVGSHQEWHRC